MPKNNDKPIGSTEKLRRKYEKKARKIAGMVAYGQKFDKDGYQRAKLTLDAIFEYLAYIDDTRKIFMRPMKLPAYLAKRKNNEIKTPNEKAVKKVIKDMERRSLFEINKIWADIDPDNNDDDDCDDGHDYNEYEDCVHRESCMEDLCRHYGLDPSKLRPSRSKIGPELEIGKKAKNDDDNCKDCGTCYGHKTCKNYNDCEGCENSGECDDCDGCSECKGCKNFEPCEGCNDCGECASFEECHKGIINDGNIEEEDESCEGCNDCGECANFDKCHKNATGNDEDKAKIEAETDDEEKARIEAEEAANYDTYLESMNRQILEEENRKASIGCRPNACSAKCESCGGRDDCTDCPSFGKCHAGDMF